VLSVYDVWMSLHRSIVEQWYERYVVPDQPGVTERTATGFQRTRGD
jgi:hypothetical protein